MDQKIQLASKRNRLQNDIDTFQRESMAYIPDGITSADGVRHDLDDGEWDTVDFLDDVDPAPEVLDISLPPLDMSPELQAINMPSLLSPTTVTETFKALQAKEVDLRVGQATDILNDVRMSVAHRSFLFRTSLRHAKNYVGNTRARREVQNLSSAVAKSARAYGHCRRAILALESTSPYLKKLLPLHKQDLKADTQALDFNQPGTRNSKLSWIWSMDGREDSPNEMIEGMGVVTRYSPCTNIPLSYSRPRELSPSNSPPRPLERGGSHAFLRGPVDGTIL